MRPAEHGARANKVMTAVERKLFTPAQIAVAAFIGSPLPAFYLLAKNYQNVGQRANARLMLIVGVVITALVLILAFYLPDRTPHSLIPIIYTICVHQMAKMAQGPFIRRHTASGGPISSWWLSVGYGLLGFIIVIAMVAAMVFAQPHE